MPVIDHSKKSPVNAVKNGWINKFESTSNSRNQQNFEKDSSSSIRGSNRGSLKLKTNEIIFNKNEIKTSSIPRNQKRKHRIDSSSRYSKYLNKNNYEIRTVRKKKELMLYGTNSNSQSTMKLDYRLSLKNVGSRFIEFIKLFELF
jgi:tRNA U34 5-carboxymethylaminomethyl modifying enzyme MnmG/GidA